MPQTRVVFYCEQDGSAPVLQWLDELPQKARRKCQVRIERLAELGHELRRPEADFLRDGIYELRSSLQGVHYRVLYFFHRTTAAVLAQGIVKEKEVPEVEIDRALERKRRFEDDPRRHTYEESS